jgi:hypothetical protein
MSEDLRGGCSTPRHGIGLIDRCTEVSGAGVPTESGGWATAMGDKRGGLGSVG